MSIVPQVLAVTPVAQTTAQVTLVLLEPVTRAEKSWVRLVITLAAVGETEIVIDEELLLPQPKALSAVARVSIENHFHRLIPVLPRFFIVRSHCPR